MVRCIGIIADYGFHGILYQYRQLIPQTLLHILRLILPHKPILLLLAQQAQQFRLFFVCQSIELHYLIV